MTKKGIAEPDIIYDPEEVLRGLDFIDKRTIIDNRDDLVSKSKTIIPHDVSSTGGTSGEPFYFPIDSSRSSFELAFIFDQWRKIGFSTNSRRITFRGNKIADSLWEDDWLTRERKFSSFDLTDEYLRNIWPHLSSYKPEYIYAYPSTALAISTFIERHCMTLPSTVKAFLLGSENIYDGQREYIERVSGAKVYLWYGHSEKLVLAGECEKSEQYHAYPQYGYAEFINEHGQQARPGEFAEIVGTGFINTVMPFIRYRTGDYCTYLGESCPECGRNYPVFKDVRGRWTQENLIGLKGNQICMSAVNFHSGNFVNVYRMQFLQEEKGYATLKIVPKEGFGEKDIHAIEKEFNKKFNGNIVITVQTVEDIPLTQRGKYKYIDQHIQ
ncbi:MAG: phenylacetate--CoA ligase family protein [Deltaproteobacteria bacterium]|nr:phenylacetate--CoA ligase family protein [Deltaproteobacteria bacterium]